MLGDMVQKGVWLRAGWACTTAAAKAPGFKGCAGFADAKKKLGWLQIDRSAADVLHTSEGLEGVKKQFRKSTEKLCGCELGGLARRPLWSCMGNWAVEALGVLKGSRGLRVSKKSFGRLQKAASLLGLHDGRSGAARAAALWRRCGGQAGGGSWRLWWETHIILSAALAWLEIGRAGKFPAVGMCCYRWSNALYNGCVHVVFTTFFRR